MIGRHDDKIDTLAKLTGLPSIRAIIRALDKAKDENALSQEQVNEVLAAGMRVKNIPIPLTSDKEELSMIELMLSKLHEINPDLEESLNPPSIKVIVRQGFRRLGPEGWAPVPGRDADTLYPEEIILEALRDKVPNLNLSHIAYVKGTIGGEGKFIVNVGGGTQQNISRDVFVKALGIPKNIIGRSRTDALDGDVLSCNFIMPEKETRAALDLPAPGLHL